MRGIHAPYPSGSLASLVSFKSAILLICETRNGVLNALDQQGFTAIDYCRKGAIVLMDLSIRKVLRK